MSARRCSLCRQLGHSRRKCHVRYARLRADDLIKIARKWERLARKWGDKQPGAVPASVVIDIATEISDLLDVAILRGAK